MKNIKERVSDKQIIYLSILLIIPPILLTLIIALNILNILECSLFLGGYYFSCFVFIIYFEFRSKIEIKGNGDYPIWIAGSTIKRLKFLKEYSNQYDLNDTILICFLSLLEKNPELRKDFREAFFTTEAKELLGKLIPKDVVV